MKSNTIKSVITFIWTAIVSFGVCQQQVHVIFRHGDRTPAYQYPSDKKINKWTLGTGALTPLGMQQLREFGAELARRYVSNGIISKIYNQKETEFRSTDLPRTLQSAEALAAGLFPCGQPGVTIPATHPWSPKDSWPARWQPVPIRSNQRDQDYLMGTANCPKSSDIETSFLAYMAGLSLSSDERQYFALIRNYTEFPDQVNLSNFEFIWDNMFVNAVHGRSPPWATFDIMNKGAEMMRRFRREEYKMMMRTPEYPRLEAGPLVSEIAKRMRASASCVSEINPDECSKKIPKLYVYSGHDSTIQNLLATIVPVDKTVLIDQQPGYTAAVIIEYWANANQPDTVKIYYRRGPRDVEWTPVDWTAPSFGGFSSRQPTLDVFERQIRQFVPNNVALECNYNQSTSNDLIK